MQLIWLHAWIPNHDSRLLRPPCRRYATGNWWALISLGCGYFGTTLRRRDGRDEAERRRLRVTGTVGVLADAHLAGLLDCETALA